MTHTVINPATGAHVADVASASVEETDAAIARAKAAFPGWRDTAPGDKARILRRFAAVIDEHLDELADLEVRNAGHTLGNARWEAGNVRDVVNYYSAAPERLFGRQIPVAGGIDVTFHEPLGVVGVIVPWNFPMPIAGWGFAPAIAAGNTVVLKPAELTPLTAIRIGELALEAGLPEGVLTVVPGKGSVVGERFVTHPDVRKVCFTGSTGVGKRIMEQGAKTLKRVFLELGGKSAKIVLDDAPDFAREVAMTMLVFHAGQGCAVQSRLLVPKSRYEEAKAILKHAYGSFGDNWGDIENPAHIMGPVISQRQKDRVLSYIELGQQEGATLLHGGKARPDKGGGFFIEPTVFVDVTNDMRIAQEEIFGPVLVVIPFEDDEDAIRIANESDYGLSGGVSSGDHDRALGIAKRIRTGSVSVNNGMCIAGDIPFGGYKASGMGREWGREGIEEFLETKLIAYTVAA
jgi:acyl-CoA reductase-like NAD-dependent aldehyde dehydrogenase